MKKFNKLFILFILVFISFVYNINEVKAESLRGIVLSNVSVKADTKSSKKIYTLKQGTSVNVIGKKGNYYILEGKNNAIGYVKKSSIALTYLLVDIKDQKLYVYNNGVKKGSANVVTGKKGVSDTPKGHYKLKRSNFKRDTYLMNNSHVEYWMPFITSRGIGFHDASWRSSSSFKKSTYIKHGSHGCVNMKTKDAKKLYENAPSVVDVIVR